MPHLRLRADTKARTRRNLSQSVREPRLQGSNALVFGTAYELQRSVDALDAVVRACMAASPGRRAYVTTVHERYSDELPLPESFGAVREIWESIALLYDAVCEPLLYCVGNITLKAHMLGRAWCVYDRSTGRITLPGGRPASEIDCVPSVAVYGPSVVRGSYSPLTREESAMVAACVAGLSELGLTYEAVDLNPENSPAMSERCVVGAIRFDPERFADGQRELMVRCVGADGGELGAAAPKAD